MLFDFQAFIEELREKEDKKQIVEKYESLFGTIQGDLKDQPRYTDYLAKFTPQQYLTPEELENDFDRDILQKLVLGSFSSDYELKKDEKKKGFELFIAVKSGDQSVVKTVSELRSFQILRLYEIYIEEQVNLHILMHEDEEEKAALTAEREMRLKKWNAVLETLDRDEKAAAAHQEQEEKLGDLMGQL
ncbi:MAG: hypothetical protein PHU61_01780 [Candidatus Absconditabacteria bacterium]|nr:hypothetical protein [Candidatus Absconditabacteria bacterium]MDD3867969.1 hypothetical protein [Candidatus Absconditabacteria bacterium]MDD4714216.1 hypothetical protein [Candidatus Absconditabacteria bacterium]